MRGVSRSERCAISAIRHSTFSVLPHAQDQVTGEAKHFARATALGAPFDHYFCPECGTTVFMSGKKNPDVTGIPIGLFDDQHSMQPIRSV